MQPPKILRHKYNTDIYIQLIEPTNKGWKVKQIEKKSRSQKETTAYFRTDEIKDLFTPIN